MSVIKGLSLTLSGIAGALLLANDLLACPNIAGSYMRPSDNLVILWEQNRCNINADAPSAGYDHSIQGRWAGSYFNYTVSRKNIKDGCITKMYGRLYQEGASRLRTEIYGTDGRCDLPPNFTENSTWDRR